MGDTIDDQGRLAGHILPTLGTKPVTALTRADIEGVRDELDTKIRAGALSWKTALNCWAVLSKLCSDAGSSKDRTLRVREDNPAAGVLPPDRGIDKSKPFLYPSELLAFVSCALIPRAWREAVACAAYMGLRAGELEALRWEDVDLERALVNVHRSIDRQRDKVKETKSGKPRRFAIEPALMPLLRKMHERRAGLRVLEMPRVRDLAERLREYLALAGVTRPELYANDATQKQLVFHDLRSTAVTWWAIRGDDAALPAHRGDHPRRLRRGLPSPRRASRGHALTRSNCPRSVQKTGKCARFWRGGRDSNPKKEAEDGANVASDSAPPTLPHESLATLATSRQLQQPIDADRTYSPGTPAVLDAAGALKLAIRLAVERMSGEIEALEKKLAAAEATIASLTAKKPSRRRRA